MPEILRVLARLGVSAATLATLAVPTLAYFHVRDRVQIGAQAPAPEPPPLTPAQLAAYSDHARTSFVVLGYHDLVTTPSEGDGRRLTVSTRTFAAHLRMLRLAGFESVSAAQVASFVQHGRPLPDRAVLITFAGARSRLWTHADQILARYGLHATVFVDPATVARATGATGGRGAMLSWPALRAMARSGRWSIGLAAPGGTVPVDPGGTQANALLAHQWLAAVGRVESTAEFQARIRAELARDGRALVDHGLPVPSLFSYPFQPGYPFDRVAAAFGELVTAVDMVFAASVLTTAPDQAVGPVWLARRVLPRIELYSPTTDALLFARIRTAPAR